MKAKVFQINVGGPVGDVGARIEGEINKHLSAYSNETDHVQVIPTASGVVLLVMFFKDESKKDESKKEV